MALAVAAWAARWGRCSTLPPPTGLSWRARTEGETLREQHWYFYTID